MEQVNGSGIEIEVKSNPDEVFDIISEFRDSEMFSFMEDDNARRVYAEKIAKSSYFTAAYYEGKVIGCLSMYMNDIESKYVYTTFLAVKTELGILASVAMMQLCYHSLEIAREKGLTMLRFEVRKDNKKAQNLVKTLGFRYISDASDVSIYMEATLEGVINRIERVLSRFSRMGQ